MTQNRFPSALIAGIIVALFFGVALYIRVVLPYDQVFVGDWIKFTGVDAYYFMRIVDNLVHNFPHLNSFDPYMFYPGGGGPGLRTFFVYFLAGITWLVGLGSPTQHTVDVVGVYFPAVLGALTVIPVYLIGKVLFNRWAGVLAAGLIAVFSGEFLGRSLLGFTDYHSAEVLFTTITMLFLILAVKSATQSGMTFKHVKSWDWGVISKPFLYSLLAGIFLGIYFLTWAGALLFVFIIFVYLVLQFIIDHLKSRSTDYLCFVSTITFTVALLIYLPASPDRVSLASFFIAIVVPVVLAVLSHFMANRGLKPVLYLPVVLGLGLASLAIFHIISPALLRGMIGHVGILWASSIGTTVYEMEPLLFPGGNFSLTVAWANFTTSFFLCFVSLGILIYSAIKRGETDKTLFIIWSLVMLAATLSMRRFAYYFVINVALLSGDLSWLILEFSGFREKAAKPAEALIEAKKKDRQKKRQRDSSRSRANPVNMALGMIVVIFLVFYPNIGPLPGGAKPPISAAKYAPFAPGDAWCESLSWLKDNTPDPFGNPDFYYDLYELPPPGESYNYPQTAYGVTAWWDYGYWITRIGHRIPSSNPGTGHTGESIVFTAQNEATAYYDTSILGFWPADHVALSKFIASSTGYITEIKLTCSGSGNVKVAIYSDCSGEPDTLLNKVDTSTAVVSGWNTITFPATSVTADTAYWLAFNSDAPVVCYSGQTGTCRFKVASYSDFTFPNSAGIGAFSPVRLLQAGYGTVSPPPSPTAPMVTNASGASNTTASSARLNGNLTSAGSIPTTVHICWGDSDGGTALDNWANDINLGIKDTGAFYTDISGLTSGRTYYYRCYATNPGGIAWATNSASFIVQAAQIQKLIGADDTPGVGSCGPDHVVLGKFIASYTGYINEIRLRCFDSGNVKVAIYSDCSGEPGTLLNKVDASTAVVSGWNTITFPATNVTADTAYWLAFNSDATIVGYSGLTGTCRVKAASYPTLTFSSYAGVGFISLPAQVLQAGYGTASLPPSPTAPMVTNASGASNTTASSARLNGNLTSAGSAPTTVHICWGDSDGGTALDNWANDINLGIKDTGAFYTDISGLTSGRTYYYRCYATNTGDIAWATNSASFIAQNAQIQKLIGADTMQGWTPKYVIVDYSTAMPIDGKFQAVATLSGSSPDKFFDVYYQPNGDKLEPVILLYPEYYRSLLIRLYNFDGKQVVPSSSIVISFEERVTRDGQPYKEITSAKSFPSYEQAEAYISSQKSGNYRIVNSDPFASPVPLQVLEHYKLVYSSESSRIMPSGSLIPEVKIFEYFRD